MSARQRGLRRIWTMDATRASADRARHHRGHYLAIDVRLLHARSSGLLPARFPRGALKPLVARPFSRAARRVKIRTEVLPGYRPFRHQLDRPPTLGRDNNRPLLPHRNQSLGRRRTGCGQQPCKGLLAQPRTLSVGDDVHRQIIGALLNGSNSATPCFLDFFTLALLI